MLRIMNLASVPWPAVKLVSIEGLEIKVTTANGEKAFQFASQKELEENFSKWCALRKKKDGSTPKNVQTFAQPSEVRL